MHPFDRLFYDEASGTYTVRTYTLTPRPKPNPQPLA